MRPHEYLTEGRIQDLWRRLYDDLIRRVSDATKGRDEHFIVKFFPLVEWVREELHSFQLAADVMVAETKNVVIPTFVWEKQNGFYQVVEWKCGYCQAVNTIEERSCTQCGAPRATLIQEM
ncbi:MAG: hypothetical protein KAI86_10185 [Desulfobacterales bacterium]|nr:hypothetical protein [Desulfobacterales bacterium]